RGGLLRGPQSSGTWHHRLETIHSSSRSTALGSYPVTNPASPACPLSNAARETARFEQVSLGSSANRAQPACRLAALTLAPLTADIPWAAAQWPPRPAP